MLCIPTKINLAPCLHNTNNKQKEKQQKQHQQQQYTWPLSPHNSENFFKLKPIYYYIFQSSNNHKLINCFIVVAIVYSFLFWFFFFLFVFALFFSFYVFCRLNHGLAEATPMICCCKFSNHWKRIHGINQCGGFMLSCFHFNGFSQPLLVAKQPHYSICI